MRRSDHPSRPSAITCCRFSALKTLPIPAAGVQPTAQVNVSAPGAALAGFQVSINGRFWVSTEEVVGGHREGEHPADAFASPESRLATQPHGLQPPEHFLDALAEPLADRVAGMARGARVERGDLLLRDVRGHVEGPHTGAEVPVIIML